MKVSNYIIKKINYLIQFFGLVIYKKIPFHHYIYDFYGKNSHKMNKYYDQDPFFIAASEVIDRKITLLYYDRLFVIYECIKNILCKYNTSKRKLVFLEIGVYKGGSSYFMASILHKLTFGKTENLQLYSIDTFEGHSNMDIIPYLEPKHSAPKIFKDTLYETVRILLSKFTFVKILKGRVQLKYKEIEEKTIDFIHLDVDIYEPTLFSLNYFFKKLSVNGMIIIDDYNFSTCPGAKKSVDEFLSIHKKYCTVFELMTGQYLIIKTK